tara:strand:+ start:902 stop:1330 length:429 start_codon:yes stop_codon:yes gene_type:complete
MTIDQLVEYANKKFAKNTIWEALSQEEKEQLLINVQSKRSVTKTITEWLAEFEDEDDDVVVTSSVVPRKYKEKYGTEANCGDDLAQKIKGVTPETPEWITICKANSIDPGRWSSLNNGLQRMNLGNVLRGRVARGEEIDITI